MTKLIFGCGYLGKRVAARWLNAGLPVVAITQSSWYAPDQNLHTFNADVLDFDSIAEIRDLSSKHGWRLDTLLYAVSNNRKSDNLGVQATGLKNVLAAMGSSITRVIHISTTGVYGPAEGDWVDERTPPDPQREGGRASLAAEQALASHPLGANSIILRLAGLYGPGRVPFLEELQAGDPIPAPSHGYLNLIHVVDAAAAVIAADRLPAFDDGPRIYCVSDGHPIERSEFYREVARRIGASAPKFVDPDPESPRTARAAADRRIRNTRMIRELNVKLAYPDYRAGLAAILETQNQ